jgi:CRISPR/Cas system-associated exonuclease Cas4 (RecB family)
MGIRLSIDQVATYCGVRRKTVAHWVRTGKLAAMHMQGEAPTIRQQDFVAFLQQRGEPIPVDFIEDNKHRILIVDDDPEVVRTLAEMFTTFVGCSIKTALDGLEAGLRLATTIERRHQEKLLFELATRQATSELVLSYPECNAKGELNLPSFFLEGFATDTGRHDTGRNACATAAGLRRPVAICEEGLLRRIGTRRAVLPPSAIEDFLQCPFLFFARYTLELEQPPARPEERLDALLQGGIVHQVLAAWQSGQQPLEPLFEHIFEQTCARERVPEGCRKELARLRMLEDLGRFVGDPPALEGWEVHTETTIQFALGEGTQTKGRIDRFDVSPKREAVVFDFKYTRPEGIRKRVRGHEEGLYVQGALYLLGLESQFGYQPAGWFYYGLKKELSCNGWHTGLPGFQKTGAVCLREELREQLEQARSVSLGVARQIREGRIEAAPADPQKCENCAFRDVCRVRTAAALALAAGEGAP